MPQYPNIEAERARKGITKTKLADEIGVSASTMKNWQSGKTEIPAKQIFICDRAAAIRMVCRIPAIDQVHVGEGLRTISVVGCYSVVEQVFVCDCFVHINT